MEEEEGDRTSTGIGANIPVMAFTIPDASSILRKVRVMRTQNILPDRHALLNGWIDPSLFHILYMLANVHRAAQ